MKKEGVTMSKNYTIWLMAVLILTMVAGSSFVYAMHITEEELGLRKENLYDEQSTYPVRGEPLKTEPGESSRIERAFENSPPLIPHDITGMLPLAQTENICLDCHMPEQAVSQGAIPIPKSHFVDLGTGEDLKGNLDGDRFNCMLCHVIQTTVTPAVVNLFKGDFRDDKGKYRSNLLDTLNEGVEAE